MSEVEAKATEARTAGRLLAALPDAVKSRALEAAADLIWAKREELIAANGLDLEAAGNLLKDGRINEAFYGRLKLDEHKVSSIAEMVRSVASLPDPIGETRYAVELDAGLELYRVSCPIGVVGVVFESRPDALPQIAALCLKSGNAVMLKGGSEAAHSNRLLFNLFKEATEEAGAPSGWVQLLEAREDVARLLSLSDLVDLIVPRGSNEFVRYIQENTRIPVLGHSEGVVHVYIDEDADVEQAVEVCLDAKVQYPSVCNALDTILVHREIAPGVLPALMEMFAEAGVEVRGCPASMPLLGGGAVPAAEDEWGTEYLDYIVSIRVVNSLGEAVDHINRFGSHHTDAVLTRSREAAMKFMDLVDSASVIWNASTRFADGYRYGLGAEVGISTGRIHARGPTGLDGLTIYKYYLVGSGQTVKPYVDGGKEFTHRRLHRTWADVRHSK